MVSSSEPRIEHYRREADGWKIHDLRGGGTLRLEAFDITNRVCRESAIWFISAWSYRIKVLGYRSAMYSSAAVLDSA